MFIPNILQWSPSADLMRVPTRNLKRGSVIFQKRAMYFMNTFCLLPNVIFCNNQLRQIIIYIYTKRFYFSRTSYERTI